MEEKTRTAVVYTIEDISDIFVMPKQIILQWIEAGSLPKSDGRKGEPVFWKKAKFDAWLIKIQAPTVQIQNGYAAGIYHTQENEFNISPTEKFNIIRRAKKTKGTVIEY